MINIAERPEIRTKIEEAEAEKQPESQTVRAPEGNGHEAAVRQQGGAR